FTPVIKQSFVAVPLLGVVWVLEYAWWHRHYPAHLGMVGRARWLAVSLSPIVVPTILYGSWLGAAGALDDARAQSAGASAPCPRAATWALEHRTALAVLVAAGLLRRGVVGVARWTAPGSAQLLVVLARAYLVVLALGAAVAVVAGRLSLSGDWATAVWWLTHV